MSFPSIVMILNCLDRLVAFSSSLGIARKKATSGFASRIFDVTSMTCAASTGVSAILSSIVIVTCLPSIKERYPYMKQP